VPFYVSLVSITLIIRHPWSELICCGSNLSNFIKNQRFWLKLNAELKDLVYKFDLSPLKPTAI